MTSENPETAMIAKARTLSALQDSTVSRIARAKVGFSVRRVPPEAIRGLLTDVTPSVGDVVMARVDNLFQHNRLFLPTGWRSYLFPGDEILVCYGHRYAPNQFEAAVPEGLEPCHLIAAGGLAGKVLSSHTRMLAPSEITPLGIVSDDRGRPINIRDWALPRREEVKGELPPVLAVVGTSMDSGKTMAASHACKGLTSAGLKVGAAKVTGTSSGGDYMQLVDAGASPFYDFVDAGYPSTYLLDLAEVERIFTTLIDHLREQSVDAIVLEIADGLFQRETAALLCSDVFREAVSSVIFTSSDAMGAQAGAKWLRARGLPVIAVSGLVTASQLGVQEARSATHLPVLQLPELAEPSRIRELLSC